MQTNGEQGEHTNISKPQKGVILSISCRNENGLLGQKTEKTWKIECLSSSEQIWKFSTLMITF